LWGGLFRPLPSPRCGSCGGSGVHHLAAGQGFACPATGRHQPIGRRADNTGVRSNVEAHDPVGDACSRLGGGRFVACSGDAGKASVFGGEGFANAGASESTEEAGSKAGDGDSDVIAAPGIGGCERV
jgi:hypothetical protein